jgi:hypothetical protein
MCEDYMEEITHKYLLKDTKPVSYSNGNVSLNVHSPHLQSEQLRQSSKHYNLLALSLNSIHPHPDESPSGASSFV